MKSGHCNDEGCVVSEMEDVRFVGFPIRRRVGWIVAVVWIEDLSDEGGAGWSSF